MITQTISSTDAAVFTFSGPFNIGEAESYSVQINFSGANVVGTLVLQASNDSTNWVDIATTSTAVTASSSALFSEGSAQWLYLRVKWTYTSGTGNLSGLVVAKQPERFNR